MKNGRRLLAVLCVFAMVMAFASITALAATNVTFNATFNSIGGSQSFHAQKSNTLNYATVNVTGYTASQSGSSVTISMATGTRTAYVTGVQYGIQIPYSSRPIVGATGQMTVTASTGVVGVGGTWTP